MRQPSKITEQKYQAFIEECFHKKTFEGAQMRKKHGIDNALISTMRREGFIVSVRSGVFNFVKQFLTQDDIDDIIKRHREMAKKYSEKRKAREGAAPAPVPTITEDQAVDFLKSLGCYEIYKVERKQL